MKIEVLWDILVIKSRIVMFGKRSGKSDISGGFLQVGNPGRQPALERVQRGLLPFQNGDDGLVFYKENYVFPIKNVFEVIFC